MSSAAQQEADPSPGKLALWRRPDVAFVLRATLWIAAIFGLMRLAPVDRAVLLLAELQGRIAFPLVGAPPDAVVVDRSCTASDALALCLGAILAFPAPWRRRLVGAALGFVLLQTANIGRIGHLAAVVDQPALFSRLHVVIWPAVLVLLSVTYVALWIRWADRRRPNEPAAAGSDARPAPPAWRFLALAVLFVAVYYALYPWLLASPMLTSVANLAAAIAGFLMRLVGAGAAVEGQILRTSYGAWLVTPECVITPLIPLFLAAVLASRRRGWRRLAALAAAMPIFLFLAVARLLVLALPAAVVGSHQVAIHAFYQVLVAVALIMVAGLRADGAPRAAASFGYAALAAIVAGLVDLRIFAPGLASLAATLHLGHGWVDPQGALDLALAYEAGLFAGLAYALGLGSVLRVAAGCAILVGLQVALRVGLGEAASHALPEFPVVAIRAWAVAVPLALVWLMALRERAARTGLRFWQAVGAEFPDLGGAASTAFYRRNEQRLFREHLAPLAGRRLFKTDLWDEARNTRILRWAAEEGAEAWGIDISLPTLLAARAEFRERGQRLRAVAADVRRIPFAARSFDLAYSMGTVEHFAETDKAIAEVRRVIRPGGRAIVGVPNRRDPFLRPLLVAGLDRLGLYAYGLEKSYSRRALRSLCRRAGFEVVDETGILFVPGALRMLDLWCWTRARPLARVTGLLIAPFAWLSERLPRLGRHGYLIAAVVVRPPLDER